MDIFRKYHGRQINEINYQVYTYFDCQVLEYQAEPTNMWVEVGDLQVGRVGHASLSIGTQHLPCFSGESFK